MSLEGADDTFVPADSIMTEEEVDAEAIRLNKQLRKDLDDVLQVLRNSRRRSRNRALAMTHLEDVIMRLGMDLKDLGAKNPYPNSRNPDNLTIDPTADGLKL